MPGPKKSHTQVRNFTPGSKKTYEEPTAGSRGYCWALFFVGMYIHTNDMEPMLQMKCSTQVESVTDMDSVADIRARYNIVT
jgi:hypothetical protein